MIDADRDIGLSRLVDPALGLTGAALAQDQYDIDAPWHHHDMHQLQYAFEGSMELEDDRGRHLLPRSLAGWIPAGTRHRNSLHRIRSVSVVLAPERVPDAGTGVRIIHVSPLMREMVATAVRWPLDRAPDATGEAFFACFARLCGEWIADQAPLTLPTTTDTSLRAALMVVRADPAGADMQAAVHAAGLSERSLRRRCQSELGMGWDEYRRRARLLASVEALTETDRPIIQVAADVGYESQSAYARAFREWTGEAPAAFRARVRG